MNLKTEHQQRIEEFMRKAKQELPSAPTLPDEKTRKLRAKLIFEEALETIEALGFEVVQAPVGSVVSIASVEFAPSFVPDLSGIADGCADISVVTVGTLSACGIADAPLLRAVDENNLAKFGPGHSIREDGKLIKPPDHRPPDIAKVLQAQVA